MRPLQISASSLGWVALFALLALPAQGKGTPQAAEEQGTAAEAAEDAGTGKKHKNALSKEERAAKKARKLEQINESKALEANKALKANKALQGAAPSLTGQPDAQLGEAGERAKTLKRKTGTQQDAVNSLGNPASNRQGTNRRPDRSGQASDESSSWINPPTVPLPGQPQDASYVRSDGTRVTVDEINEGGRVVMHTEESPDGTVVRVDTIDDDTGQTQRQRVRSEDGAIVKETVLRREGGQTFKYSDAELDKEFTRIISPRTPDESGTPDESSTRGSGGVFDARDKNHVEPYVKKTQPPGPGMPKLSQPAPGSMERGVNRKPRLGKEAVVNPGGKASSDGSAADAVTGGSRSPKLVQPKNPVGPGHGDDDDAGGGGQPSESGR